jgi:hypothetical protein
MPHCDFMLGFVLDAKEKSMPPTVMFEPRHLQLVLSMRPTAFLPGRQRAQKVDQLFEALEVIQARMSDNEIYYFALDVGGSHRTGEEFNPWTNKNIADWGRLAIRPELRPRLKEWLGALATLLKDAQSSGRSTASLWELDEYQLGEAAASACAFVDVSLVPCYTRLLRLWDMDHEVRQFDTINEIIEHHGICAQTEELLYVRTVEARGQTGDGQIEHLLPILNKAYGDFTTSTLFRRMVQGMHATDLAWRLGYKGDNVAAIKVDPAAKQPNLSNRRLFFSPTLQSAAAGLLAELDARAGLSPV